MENFIQDNQPRKSTFAPLAKWGIFSVAAIGFLFFSLRIIAGRYIQETQQAAGVIDSAPISPGASGSFQAYKAPMFSLPNVSGGAYSLSDSHGMPLVLVFWSMWNPMSVDQMRVISDYYKNSKDSVFKVVLVNSQEDAGAVANFLRRGGYDVPVVLDVSGATGEAYGIRTLPTLYFIDREGIVRDEVIGVLDEDQLIKHAELIVR